MIPFRWSDAVAAASRLFGLIAAITWAGSYHSSDDAVMMACERAANAYFLLELTVAIPTHILANPCSWWQDCSSARLRLCLSHMMNPRRFRVWDPSSVYLAANSAAPGSAATRDKEARYEIIEKEAQE